MNNNWAFLPMRSSSSLLDDPEALRSRFEEDGYLYLDGVLDRDRIAAVHDAVVDELVDAGWVERRGNGEPWCLVEPIQEGENAYFEAYDRVQRLEQFHLLAHDPALHAAVETALGGRAFAHPLKIARLVFPGNFEHSTPPHQDDPNNQGDPRLTATWIPLHDQPEEMGGLAVLAGSHHFGRLPLRAHWGPGNRAAALPLQVLEACRWVTTSFRAGDVLVFGSHTVHAAMHNASELHMRLSVDYRFQPDGAALTPITLEPHFQRLSWEEIYEDWTDTEHRYYWRDHAYEIVPFEELALTPNTEPEEPLRAHVAMKRRIAARFARRSSLIESGD